MVRWCLPRGLGEDNGGSRLLLELFTGETEAGGLPLTLTSPGAVDEDEEGRITEGDLAPETTGAEEPEVGVDPDSPGAVDRGDVGVGGAAVSSGLADVSEAIICWPATL